MPKFLPNHVLPRCDGSVDRRSFLPALARGRRVVHLGCVDEHLTLERAGTGRLLHQELAAVADDLLGVDISHDGLEQLRGLVPGSYLEADVERLDDLDLPDADLVLAPEIIEHLANPGAFLHGLRGYLARTGAQGVITTPNAYGWTGWATFAGRGREATHPDHVLLYSPITLEVALGRAGLRPVQRFAHRWSRGPSGLRDRLLDAVEAALYAPRPWLAPGLIYVVEPS